MPIIQAKILAGSTIYTDGWKNYDGVILNGYVHYQIFHYENEFVSGKNHINEMESFLLDDKSGLAEHTFLLLLKECEF